MNNLYPKYLLKTLLNKTFFVFIICTLHFVSCAQNTSLIPFTFKIASKDSFNYFAGTPLSQAYNNVSSIKIVYDRFSKKLFYVNSKRYKYHIDFCVDFFGIDDDIMTFNNEQYGVCPNRRFYLASLSHFADQSIYALEFVSEDELTIPQLNELYTALKKSMSDLGEPKLLVNNSFLQQVQHQIKNIPTITPEILFGNQTQASLVVGTSFGIARKIVLKNGMKNISEEDIIFFDGTPIQLPNCAGVITSTMQTPLSHINVLCNNRKTPAAVLLQYDSIMNALQAWDKPIKLAVSKGAISISLATQTELDAFKKNKKIKPIISLIYNKAISPITPFKSLPKLNKQTIGAKAWGVLQLYKIQKYNKRFFKVPNTAFAIPFYYYDMHLKKCKIDSLIKLLQHPNVDKSAVLMAIKKRITTSTIDKKLLQLVHKQLQLNPKVMYRFRSSSNAEDLTDFNGAGLYGSYSGSLADTNKTVERAIKKVWASVWSESAYNERELFNINHYTVSMAVLVHQAFGDEDINGVAITKNLYREGFTGFTINVQKGEASVVAPDSNIQCDQLLILPSESFTGKAGSTYMQYINVGNLNNGLPVLTIDQGYQLYRSLDAVKQHYYYNHLSNQFMDYDLFGLDIEFKFIGKDLYLKQVRPYK
jgi:pyruvate, water dikinase